MSKQDLTNRERRAVLRALVPISLMWADMMERNEMQHGADGSMGGDVNFEQYVETVNRTNLYIRETYLRLGMTQKEWNKLAAEYQKGGE